VSRASGLKYLLADETRTAAMRLKVLERQIERDVWSQAQMLCLPTAPTIHVRATVDLDPGYGSTSVGAYTNFAPFLGLPAISVPNGFRPDGLPTGIMFVCRHADDLRMLYLAKSFAS
jgi:allophanate hydrolase